MINRARRTTHLFFATLLVGFFVLLAFLSFGLWQSYEKIKLRRDLDEATVRHSFDMIEYTLASIYRSLSTDMTAFTALSSLHVWLEKPDQQKLQLLIHDWSSLLRSFSRYHKLYYADEKGQPLIILQYDYPTDELTLPDPQTERKPQLLEQGARLPRHEIAQQQLPVVAVESNNTSTFEEASAVFDSQGRRHGTLVMTYDTGEIMRLFQRVDLVFPYSLSAFNDHGVPVYCRNFTDIWHLDDASPLTQGCVLPPMGNEMWKTMCTQRFGTFYDQRGLNYHFKASIPGFRTGVEATTMVFISCYSSSLPGYERESIFATAFLTFFRQYWPVMTVLLILPLAVALVFRRWEKKSSLASTKNHNGTTLSEHDKL